MRITKLSVRDFRRYREFEVPLAPGLTIVHGPNEAGKTTIQRALELVLTKKATAGGQEMDGFRSWDAPDDARPVIAIDFEVDDDDNGGGSRPGSIEKSFQGQRGTVRLELDGQVITDPTLADQALAELTGIPTEAFFRSTASIRHHELADLDRDEATLRDRLQASISGADRGTSRAKKRLERAIFELKTQGQKNPGRLKVAEEMVGREQGFVDQGEMALAQLERDRDTLAGAKERRASSEADLGERRAMLEKARQAERLATERAAAQERFERYRPRSRCRRSSPASARAIPRRTRCRCSSRSSGGCGRSTRGRASSRPRSRARSRSRSRSRRRRRWRPISRIALLLVALGLLVAAAAFAVNRLTTIELGTAPMLLGGALAGIGLILAFVALVAAAPRPGQHGAARRRGRTTPPRPLRDGSRAEAVRGRHRPAAPGRRPAGPRRRRGDARRRAGAHGRDRAAPGPARRPRRQGTGRDAPERRDTAALEIEQKGHALEALGPIAWEPRARERLEVEIRDLESALERARDDEANARARVDTNPVDAEAVAGHAELLATWRDELAALQRRTRVYERTLREIEAAEQATMKTATRYLEETMVADIARVTEGRYRRVQVDDKTFDIRVHAPERGDWVDVTSLSQGTLDLVYLVARIGLVRLVTGDKRPPLILDDPFVTFDDERAKRSLELLRDVARDFQVIYLTTSDRYDASADAVVLLAGPTELDDGDDSLNGTGAGSPGVASGGVPARV